VDILTISGHKIQGPKGVGVLYMREGVELEPLITGGHQERGLRAGTENIIGIAGMGKAAEIAVNHLTDVERIRSMRDRLEQGIIKIILDAVVNGHPEKGLLCIVT
jgi:cysteine desulfurase